MRRGRSRSKHSLDDEIYLDDDDDDDDDREWGNESNSEDLEISSYHMETRAPKIHKDNDYANIDDLDIDDEEEIKKVTGPPKIDKILMTRANSSGEIEYLILYQKQTDHFAQWVPSSIAKYLGNFDSRLKKFNTTPMNISLYSSTNNNFSSSYSSPLKILAHRKIDPSSNSLEFLHYLSVETGPAFFWEPLNENANSKLIEDYMAKLKCVENTFPQRPEQLKIEYADKKQYHSVEGNIPRDYQVDGTNWMLACFCAGHGCILADEMGLGKTIQTLMYLMHLNRYSEFHGPNLIAVRTNTFNQWCSEIERWSDLKYVPYAGQPEARQMIQQYQMPYLDENGTQVPNKYSFNICLVTYEIFLKDSDYFSTIPWQNIIVDEGHRIKNVDGKKHVALAKMKAMNRIILTGTPIQNTIFELWTLLNFVSPEYFPDSSLFPADDVETLDKNVLEQLKTQIAPHLMRRTLDNVEKTIVPKDERISFLKITEIQEDFMRLIKLHQLYRIQKGQESNDIVNESNLLQRTCNHPFLIGGGEEYLMKKFKNKSRLEILVESSAKFIFLDRILPIFKRQGRSVLIFSQKVKVLSLLDEYCTLKRYTHELLVGTLTDQEKKQVIQRFTDPDGDVFIFLISTRSGSEGLNLTRANITIIFDPDWNPQNDIQALGRCHRIGQTQKVDVIRLLTYGTYEHEMYVRSQRKNKLWIALLGDGQPNYDAVLQKPEVEVQKKPRIDSLINPMHQHDANDFEGFSTISEIKEMTQDIHEEEKINADFEPIPEPPNLIQISFDPKQCSSFEEMMELNSSVTTDIQQLGTNSSNFPKIDITQGLSDQDFLQEKFPFDENILKQNKRTRQRSKLEKIVIEPKVAKTIFKQIEVHGYGEWEKITEEMNDFCSLDQITKFCVGSVLLHLRAVEPARVSCYPLLIYRLKDDLAEYYPNFDIALLCCKDPSEWFSVLPKRAQITQDVGCCKQIYNHIQNTAPSFLSKLENHLLIKEWIKDEKDFPFQNLPPYFGRSREEDVDLYNKLINKQDIPSSLNPRVNQMLIEMRAQLIRANETKRAFKFQYWSKFEINNVINSLKNFGPPTHDKTAKDILVSTALLSKDQDQCKKFVNDLVIFLQRKQKHEKKPLTLPPEMCLTSLAPEDAKEEVVIEFQVINDIFKRIFINSRIRKVMKEYIASKENLNEIVHFEKETPDNWLTFEHLRILFTKMIRYGCDVFMHVLLEDEFRSHLTDDDVQWLIHRDKKLIINQSKIPFIFLSDQHFYKFLNTLLPAQPQAQPHPVAQAVPPPLTNIAPKQETIKQQEPKREQQRQKRTTNQGKAVMSQSLFGVDFNEFARVSNQFNIPLPPPPPPPLPPQSIIVVKTIPAPQQQQQQMKNIPQQRKPPPPPPPPQPPQAPQPEMFIFSPLV